MKRICAAAVLAILLASTGAFAMSHAMGPPAGFQVNVGGGPPSGVPGLGPSFDVPTGPPAWLVSDFPGLGPGAFFVKEDGLLVGDCGGMGPPAECFKLNFEITADPDPSITIVLGVTNQTASTQSFVFEVRMPIDPTLSGSLTADGSVQGTLTDGADRNGATFSSTSDIDIYTALFNPSGGGSGTQTASGLFVDPFSFSVAAGASGAPMPAGAFGPTAFNVTLLDEIGIRIAFDLSPFDVVAFTGTFFVIPEPGTATLLLTGLTILAASGSGRRRRAP